MKKYRFLMILSLLVCGLLYNNSAYAVDETKISELLAQLGAKSFKERENASASLLRIGKPAIASIKIAVESSDPEIRMRARKLLEDIKLGINPDWPEELQDKVRGFEKLNDNAKNDLINRLTASSEKEAVSFLLMIVEKGDSSDAQMALKSLLGLKDLSLLWKTVLSWDEAPVNKYQAELLARASARSGEFNDVLKALASKHLEDKMKKGMLSSRIAIIDGYLREKQYQKAEVESIALAKAFPNNAIILYSLSDALARLGKKYESVRIANIALDLNPESEAPHYAVATRLMELGRYRLAEMEWKIILDIPPDNTVYDINAYIRLSTIYEKSELYSKSLDALKTAVKKYKEAKEENGSSMGMVGADKLDDKIAYLRKMANEKGDAAGMDVDDLTPKKESFLQCNLNIIVKDNKQKEMDEELKKLDRTMTLNVQPPGLKLLQKQVLKLKYDKEKKQFSVMLNDYPCAVEKNFELKKETAKVVVVDQDVCNIYKIERDTGKVELLKSYEKDYILKITKGKDILSWTDTVVKVNNKEYPWENLEEGIMFDVLPADFKIDLKGVDSSGKEKSISVTVGLGTNHENKF